MPFNLNYHVHPCPHQSRSHVVFFKQISTCAVPLTYLSLPMHTPNPSSHHYLLPYYHFSPFSPPHTLPSSHHHVHDCANYSTCTYTCICMCMVLHIYISIHVLTLGNLDFITDQPLGVQICSSYKHVFGCIDVSFP